MATSKNGKKHSTVRPAPDQSSLRSVAPKRSATVTEYDIDRRALIPQGTQELVARGGMSRRVGEKEL